MIHISFYRRHTTAYLNARKMAEPVVGSAIFL